MSGRTHSNPSGKALWYVENHFREEIGLDEIATAAGISRYHHQTRRIVDTWSRCVNTA